MRPIQPKEHDMTIDPATHPADDHAELGWFGINRDSPEIVRQREYLEANTGLDGLEVLGINASGGAVTH